MLVASRKLSKLSLSNSMRVGGKADRRVLSLDLSMRSLRDIDTFTRASGDQWLDFDGNYRTAGINEPVYENSRYLSPGVYSWFDLSGNLIPGIKLTTGPAVTNKCQTFGFVPDDEIGPELTEPDLRDWNEIGVPTEVGVDYIVASSGIGVATDAFLSKGKVYTVVADWDDTTGDFDLRENTGGAGTVLLANPGTITFVSQATSLYFRSGVTPSRADNVSISIKEVKYAVGTKSFHDGSSFIQNIDGMTLSGDVAGVLSIVDDTTQLDTDWYGGVERNGKCYQLDNSLGSADSFVIYSGAHAVAALDPISMSLVERGGTGRLTIGGSGNPKTISSESSFAYFKNETAATAVGQSAVLHVDTTQSINFLLPGLYEQSYAPRQPVPASSLIASTTRSASLSTLPVQMQQSFKHTLEVTPDANGADLPTTSSILNTQDSRGAANQITTDIGAYGYVHATGGGTFSLLASDVVKDTSAIYEFLLDQNGANVDWSITLDGVPKGSGSVVGVLDHSNQNTTTLPTMPAQVKLIEVKAI